MEMVTREDSTRVGSRRDTQKKLSIIVGENLRQLRRAQGLSLEQLSQVAGVSRAMLGQIETGKSAPTINLLGRIGEALNVSVARLIAAPTASQTIVVPREQSTVLSSSEGGFTSRALFPWGDSHALEIYEITISAGHEQHVDACAAGAKKTLVVTAGELVVTVGSDAPARLGEGDVILFNADTSHIVHNTSRRDAKAFLVVNGAPCSQPHTRPL